MPKHVGLHVTTAGTATTESGKGGAMTVDRVGSLPVTNRCIGPTVNRSNWRQFPEVVRVE